MKKSLCLGILLTIFIFCLTACGISDTSREIQQGAIENHPTAAPTPTNPDFTDVKQSATECLSNFYGTEELIKLTASDKKVEANIQAAFPLEETQPDNWNDVRTGIEEASSSLLENLSEYEIPNAVIYLIDSNGTIFLTASNGTISYDKYEAPEPTPTPSSTTIMVWISSNGNHYHRTSTCSGMTGAWQVIPENAWAMGYTACKHCY